MALLRRNQIRQMWRGFVNPIVGLWASKLHSACVLLLQSLLRVSCTELLIVFLCVSFCPHATVQLPQEGFLWYFLFGILLKLVDIPILFKIWQKMKVTLRETQVNVIGPYIGNRGRLCGQRNSWRSINKNNWDRQFYLWNTSWGRRNSWRSINKNNWDRQFYLWNTSWGWRNSWRSIK